MLAKTESVPNSEHFHFSISQPISKKVLFGFICLFRYLEKIILASLPSNCYVCLALPPNLENSYNSKT